MFELTVTFFVALMLYTAYSDLKAYTLPNFISVALILGFICVAFYVKPPFYVLSLHVAVMVAAFVIGFILFALNLFGGGDVKVLTGLALWFGPNNSLSFFMSMAILGGVLAVLIVLFRRFELPSFWKENKSARDLHDPENGIPYGVAIAIAALVEFPNSEVYQVLA